MARAPFQVLVIPYRRGPARPEYALFLRSDGDIWQGIAGGGEDDETPLEAARREAREEAGIDEGAAFARLDATASIRADSFAADWGPRVYVIPEHSFGVAVEGTELALSHEHRRCAWLGVEAAMARATFDSNRTAIWELDRRLADGALRGRHSPG